MYSISFFSLNTQFSKPPEPRKKQKERNARIKSKVEGYKREEALEYLDGLAPNIKYN